jgi:hypothetical protein
MSPIKVKAIVLPSGDIAEFLSHSGELSAEAVRLAANIPAVKNSDGICIFM